MAEYVRRRRPPASHPYWDRMHDRAHPPLVALPIFISTAVGAAIGLFGGLRPAYTMTEAVRTAGVGAAGLAGAAFVIATVVLLFDAAREMPRHERWAAAAIGGTAIAAVAFVMSVIMLVVLLAWYSAGSGKGPWLGMLYGAIIGGFPAAAIAAFARQRWRERQKQWPRWERMRTPRRRRSLNVIEHVMSPAGRATGGQSAASDSGPDSPSGRRDGESAPRTAIGESGDET